MPAPLMTSFSAGDVGDWRIDGINAIAGSGLDTAKRLSVTAGAVPASAALWTLRGTTSNQRYTIATEAGALRAQQAGLGRPAARAAAMIAIRKTSAWWDLAQDERRAVFEDQSRHIGIGMDYLPAVARRLYHGRDRGEPFDFITWFEFAPEHGGDFDHMLARLRATPEWAYIDREVDVRLTRVATAT